MESNYKEKFTVGTDGMHRLVYRDSSCEIELPAADVRDISIWVSVGKVFSKIDGSIVKLSKNQRLQVYNRVSAIMRIEGHEGIYTDEFKLIEEDLDYIDYTKDILDIK